MVDLVGRKGTSVVEHVVDLADYVAHPNNLAALLTGNGVIARARGQLGCRLDVLDRCGDTYLVTIDPPPANARAAADSPQAYESKPGY